jgi:hypothetical protein
LLTTISFPATTRVEKAIGGASALYISDVDGQALFIYPPSGPRGIKFLDALIEVSQEIRMDLLVEEAERLLPEVMAERGAAQVEDADPDA